MHGCSMLRAAGVPCAPVGDRVRIWFESETIAGQRDARESSSTPSTAPVRDRPACPFKALERHTGRVSHLMRTVSPDETLDEMRPPPARSICSAPGATAPSPRRGRAPQ